MSVRFAALVGVVTILVGFAVCVGWMLSDNGVPWYVDVPLVAAAIVLSVVLYRLERWLNAE